MPITFYCPSCNKRLRAPDNANGKKKKCPNCGTSIQIQSTTSDSSASTRPSVDVEWPKPFESVEPTELSFHGIEPAAVTEEAQTSCLFCHAETLSTAKFCPSCGKKLPSPTEAALIQRTTQTANNGCAIGCLSIFGLFILISIFSPKSNDSKTNTHSVAENSAWNASPASQWYQGGTLHNQSAIDWQRGSAEDKLATCGDFVTKMWKNGDLKSEISDNLSTVDDVRPYAQELVNFLDTAFRLDPDPEQNSKLFTNQTVSSTAVIGMITMGWTKRGK